MNACRRFVGKEEREDASVDDILSLFKLKRMLIGLDLGLYES